jgi:hypothetical protein
MCKFENNFVHHAGPPRLVRSDLSCRSISARRGVRSRAEKPSGAGQPVPSKPAPGRGCDGDGGRRVRLSTICDRTPMDGRETNGRQRNEQTNKGCNRYEVGQLWRLKDRHNHNFRSVRERGLIFAAPHRSSTTLNIDLDQCSRSVIGDQALERPMNLPAKVVTHGPLHQFQLAQVAVITDDVRKS